MRPRLTRPRRSCSARRSTAAARASARAYSTGSASGSKKVRRRTRGARRRGWRRSGTGRWRRRPSRPPPMASTTEAGPVTASPPAKTHGSDVWPVIRVDGDVALEAQVDLDAVHERLGVEPLADGGDDRSASTTKLGVVRRRRAAPAALVEVAERHLPAAHARDLAALVAHDLLRGRRGCRSGRPRLGVLDLFGPGGHLVARCAGRGCVTSSAPRRRAVRAASMAALPPPITTTFLPIGADPRRLYSSQEARGRRRRPVASSPGMPSRLPVGGADAEEDGLVALVLAGSSA